MVIKVKGEGNNMKRIGTATIKFNIDADYRKHTNMYGEGQIKAQTILNAFENYRMQSRLYRILKFLRLR